MVKAKIPPLNAVYLYFSSSCNLRCRHCWIDPDYSAERNPKTDLSLDRIIAALEECIPLGLSQVKITGGEPFIRRDILRLLDYLVSRKLGISIESNGTFIREKEAKAIKKAKVSSVAISLDAPTAELHEELRQVKGSFQKAVEGIGHLKKAGVNNIQVITCLWRRNAHKLRKMIQLANSLGVNSLKINPVFPTCRAHSLQQDEMLLSAREVVDIYHRLNPDFNQNGMRVLLDLPPAFLTLEDFKKGRGGCCSLKTILGILADGRISICGIGQTVEKLVLGKVGRDSIKEIWENNAILKQIREELPQKLKGVCGKCLFRFFCLGKCRAAVFYAAENLLDPFSLCQDAYEQGFFPKSRLVS